jgi:hypothetical protein
MIDGPNIMYFGANPRETQTRVKYVHTLCQVRELGVVVFAVIGVLCARP